MYLANPGKISLVAALALFAVGCTNSEQLDPADSSWTERSAKQVGSAVVATVNDFPILRKELDAAMSGNPSGPRGFGRSELSGEDAAEPALSRLIEEKLLVTEALRLDLVRHPLIMGSMLALVQTNNASMSAADNSTAEGKEALLKIALQQKLEREPRIQKALAALLLDREVYSANRQEVSEAAVREAYERRRNEVNAPASVHLLDLLVKADPNEPGRALAKIRKLRSELAKHPELFREYARQHSEGAFASLGGDLGVISANGRSGLDKKLLTAAFALQPGVVSSVIKAADGYHLALVTAKHEPVVRTFEDLRPVLERDLRTKMLSDRRASYLAKLRSTAKVVILQDLLASLSPATER